jgi:uncharacterized repeat protein (TIGR03847 family)
VSWVVGAVGRPGERTFYVQFTSADGTHSYLLEKVQVAALVAEARKLLQSAAHEGRNDPEPSRLDGSVMPEFRVAEIHLAYTELDGMVAIRLIPSTDEMEPVEFVLTVAQFSGAIAPAQGAVEGGRPSCPRCGLAMDPDGHHCPATNGDLRGHRP